MVEVQYAETVLQGITAHQEAHNLLYVIVELTLFTIPHLALNVQLVNFVQALQIQLKLALLVLINLILNKPFAMNVLKAIIAQMLQFQMLFNAQLVHLALMEMLLLV